LYILLMSHGVKPHAKCPTGEIPIDGYKEGLYLCKYP
jgi:hypothetical protein